MAKQLGIIQFRGKLGDLVGAKRAGAQKANTMRVRVREIANPKTTAQIQQRMRVLPAVNFYRMLQPVLNHAFQGTAYKAPSYGEFMRLALKNDDFPYVVKGETLPIPGMYQISKGSLPSIIVDSFKESAVIFNLTGDSRWSNDGYTIGQLSKLWVGGGSAIQNGDQLTFVIVSADDGSIYGSQIYYQTAALVINTESSVTLSSWLNDNYLEMFESNAGKTAIRRYQDNETFVVAGAVIVSRPPSSAGGAWLRSNTVLSVAPAVLKETRTAQAYQLAFDSYGDAAKVLSSDWYLNQSRARYKTSSSYIFSGVFQEVSTKPLLMNAMFVNVAGVPMLVVDHNEANGNVYIFNGEEAQPTTVALTASQTNAITIGEVRGMFPDLVISDTTYDPGTDGGSDDDDDEEPQP